MGRRGKNVFFRSLLGRALPWAAVLAAGIGVGQCAIAAARSGDDARAVTVVVKSVKPEEAAASSRRVASYGLTRDDYRRIVETIPGIKKAVPIRELNEKARYGERVVEVRMIGTTPAFTEMHALRVARGRFLADADVATLNNLAVVNERIAQRLFPGQTAIGKNIRIGKNYFLVVGESSGNDAAREADVDVYIPLSTMRARMGDVVITRRPEKFDAEKYELSRIEITLDDPANALETADLIRRLLQKFHERPDYSVYVAEVLR